jgi:hypothetical protein
MRARLLLPFLAAAALFGCAGEVRSVRLAPAAGGAFTFGVATNTVITENDDGAAERIRRDWLAESLVASGTCRSGYVVDSRRLVQAQAGIFANGGDIVYAGHCL